MLIRSKNLTKEFKLLILFFDAVLFQILGIELFEYFTCSVIIYPEKYKCYPEQDEHNPMAEFIPIILYLIFLCLREQWEYIFSVKI